MQIVSEEESICTKCQMLSPGENKKTISKCGLLKMYTEQLPKGQGFLTGSLLLICLIFKYLKLRDFKKRMFGFKL